MIGYLPALYSAYSERERKLMVLDDGTEERITPIDMLLAPQGFWGHAIGHRLAADHDHTPTAE